MILAGYGSCAVYSLMTRRYGCAPGSVCSATSGGTNAGECMRQFWMNSAGVSCSSSFVALSCSASERALYDRAQAAASSGRESER